jgi:hypothetical protein
MAQSIRPTGGHLRNVGEVVFGGTRMSKFASRVSLITASQVVAGAAFATPITRTFDITVNNVQDQTGNHVSPPVNPVVGSFTVTFDPALGLINNQTTGITELRGRVGDGVNQAVDLISATASIPSLNFIPLTTFGN